METTIADEARKNELTVAKVRVFALLFLSVQHWLSALNPGPNDPVWPLALPLVFTAWTLTAAGLMLALKSGFYRDALRTAIPLSDGAMIWLIYVVVRASLGPAAFLELGGLANLAISSALLIVTGAMRLSTGAVVLTTLLGMTVYTSHAVRAGTWSQEMSRGITLLLAIGFFAWWMTRLVRRAMQGEIGRVTLRRFLPERVIDAAFDDPKSLVSTAWDYDATVLISDLRGFTAISESLAPAEALALLNEIQGALADVVCMHGGTVDKFMGDGLLAVFGAYEREADHAGRAIMAAVAMRERISAFNQKRRARGQAPIDVGIGVHSGAVITGCLGSGERLEYTVIGDTVNTASRLEAETKSQGVSVIVSDETLRRARRETLGAALRDGRSLVACGEVALRGKKQALSVHAIVDA